MQSFPKIQLLPTEELAHGDVIAYGDNKRGLVWQFAPVTRGGIPPRGASIIDLDDFLPHSLNSNPPQHYFLKFGGRLEIRPCFRGSIEYSDQASPGDLVFVGLQEKRQTLFLALRHPSDGSLSGFSFSNPQEFCFINAHYKDYTAIIREWDLVLCEGEQEVIVAERRFPPVE